MAESFVCSSGNSLVIRTLLWDIKYLPFPLVFLESSFGNPGNESRKVYEIIIVNIFESLDRQT